MRNTVETPRIPNHFGSRRFSVYTGELRITIPRESHRITIPHNKVTYDERGFTTITVNGEPRLRGESQAALPSAAVIFDARTAQPVR